MKPKPSQVIFYFCFEGFSRLGEINNHIRETVSWLAKFGHEVHFFNPNIVKPSFSAKVYIHLIPVINFPFLRWATFEFLSFFILIWNILKRRPNHLYFRETSSFIPLLVSKLFHIPLTIEVNGWVIEELRQVHYSPLKIAYIRLNQYINFCYCDRIITVSNGLKNLIATNYPVKAAKVIPIANGTNPDIFRPIPKSEALAKTGLPDVPTVGFIGSCYHYHGVQYLIKAAPYVLKKMPEVHFVVAGDGAQLEEWKELSHELKLDKAFTFTGKVPFNLALYYINSYDICVAPWDVSLLLKVGLSPMKFYDYLACEKPVIVSPVYGVVEIINKYNCAIICDVKKPELFAEIIINLFSDQKQRELLGKSARVVVMKHFTWEITSRKIEQVLKEIK
ncbi:MAG TPA: glycosyltransferase family 4 protein [Candidatus Marinimicrobia bacterium]|nr:glycosyltransferase family 4 protein [Candidatus Neomarinimicrobiota bacterium]HRS51463.1 glycosyltransferase family 4 protein [Candidatus Neomarinimicrobiota bacterium]HRU92733.1 glycosyltransferase family 4 protein [Candidatus Neomarinimicrobiota bacterium]